MRFYNGATGLKTGTTNGAGSCLAATATRDNLSLVAVVMGSNTSDERFASARGLLDYGFGNYMAVQPPPIDASLAPVKVLRGLQENVMPTYKEPNAIVIEKEYEDKIKQEVTLAADVEAPVQEGQTLGTVRVLVNGEVAGEYSLLAGETVERMTFLRAFQKLCKELVTMRR